MNIRELEYLVALSEHRHFGKAAEMCFVSQPALSMQIKKLEEYLDVQLIERSNKSVWLTEIGETICKQARKILNQISDLRETAKLLKDPYCGEFRLGIIPTLAPYLLPNVFPTLLKAFPKLLVRVTEEKTTCIIDKLRNGRLDAIMLAPLINEPEFDTVQLFKEEFMLAVPKQHPLAKRKRITQKVLENQCLLLLEDGHCTWQQSKSLSKLINDTDYRNFRATSLETLRHMVATGVGITLLPKLACKSAETIRYIHFTSPCPVRTVGMLWRSSTAKKSLMEDIAQQIRKKMAKLI